MASSVLTSQEEEEEEEDVESYNSGEHSGYLINNMEQFRVDSGFTDITIEVEGQRFACHKVILAAGSPYFRLVFCMGTLIRSDTREFIRPSAEF